MKGNPFTRDLFRAESLVGRKEEISLFERRLDGMLNAGHKPEAGGLKLEAGWEGKGRLAIALSGVRGLGKTSLIGKFVEIAQRNKVLAVHVRARYGEQSEELMKKVLRYAANEALEKVSLGTLPKASEKLFSAFRDSLYSKHMTAAKFAQGISEFYSCIRHEAKGMAIFLDNIDEADGARKTVLEFSRAFSELKKTMPIGIVCSSTLYFPEFAGFCEELEVGRLSDAEVRECIALALKEVKIKTGEEFLHSVIGDSEGNPRILFNICWTVFDKLGEKDKVMAKGHYIAYSATIMNNLSKDIFDELYYRTSEHERGIIKKIASMGGEATVSGLAEAMKKKLNTITTLVLRLYESGNLVKVERGRYRLFNKLYGKYLLEYV